MCRKIFTRLGLSHGGYLHLSLLFYYAGNREPQVTLEQDYLVQSAGLGMSLLQGCRLVKCRSTERAAYSFLFLSTSGAFVLLIFDNDS